MIFFKLYMEQRKMDRNEKEKNMLREWAKKNNAAYRFTAIDMEKESYFIKRSARKYIREYQFETLPELLQELDYMWQDENSMAQIKKIVAVAALKNRPSEEIQKQTEKHHAHEKKELLPEFIYNF